MKIALVIPFGVHRVESTGLYLVAHYLRSMFSEVIQLRCNGSFLVCDRDEKADWKRGITDCMQCMQEQKLLSDWADISHVKMSSLIDSDQIRDITQWVARLLPEHLVHASYEKLELFDLCKGTFFRRFGVEFPDVTNRDQELFLRGLLRASAIAVGVARRFVAEQSPDVSFICGSSDYITAAYRHILSTRNKKAIVGTWKQDEHALIISHPENSTTFSCGLVFDSLSAMRPDVASWPQELTETVEDLLAFVGLTDAQLTLPIAR